VIRGRGFLGRSFLADCSAAWAVQTKAAADKAAKTPHRTTGLERIRMAVLRSGWGEGTLGHGGVGRPAPRARLCDLRSFAVSFVFVVCWKARQSPRAAHEQGYGRNTAKERRAQSRMLVHFACAAQKSSVCSAEYVGHDLAPGACIVAAWVGDVKQPAVSPSGPPAFRGRRTTARCRRRT
jgi:hypothetical protein